MEPSFGENSFQKMSKEAFQKLEILLQLFLVIYVGNESNNELGNYHLRYKLMALEICLKSQNYRQR